MDSLAFNIFLVGAFLTLFAVYFVYSFIDHTWKQKPSRPFIIGFILLFVSFAWQVYLSTESTSMKSLIEKGAITRSQGDLAITEKNAMPKAAVAFWKSNVVAYEAQSKWIELLIIPLAVSLIATAFFVKADLALADRVKEYKSFIGKFDQREKEIALRESGLEIKLENDERGLAITDEFKLIRQLRIQLVLDRADLRREYVDVLG